MSEQFVIGSSMTEKSNASLKVKVAQVSPEDKPGFFSSEITYGDMSAESVAQLRLVWNQFQARVTEVVGQDPSGVIRGSYDDLMCVQVLSRELVETLCDMGFEYAKQKGIPVPKAEDLRGHRGS